MPWTAYILKHNPLVSYFSKDSTMFPGWTARRVQNRLKKRDEEKRMGFMYSPRDFLDRFIDAAHTGPNQEFEFAKALGWTLTNVMAGGDTTTIALKAIVYYLLKNPDKKNRLIQDLEEANLTVPVPWTESQQIPYLDAVIKESLRLHPPIGLGLERTAGGFVMPDGYTVPQGTNVGMNAWVVNRQPIFGENVDDFIPERWLKGPDETVSQHKNRVNDMKRADLVFGSGARACTGRSVSYLEIYKIVPSFLLTFDFNTLRATDEWTLVCGWSVRQDNIKCFLRTRQQRL
jgi:cytochrome P450